MRAGVDGRATRAGAHRWSCWVFLVAGVACAPDDPVAHTSEALAAARAEPSVAALAPGELRAVDEALASATHATSDRERQDAAARAERLLDDALAAAGRRRSEVESGFLERARARDEDRLRASVERNAREAELVDNADHADAAAAFAVVDARDVQRRLATGGPVLFLDVRGRDAWALAHAVGSQATSALELSARSVPDRADLPVVLVGARGASADVVAAATTLRALGLRPSILRDGFEGWRKAGLPTEGTAVTTNDEAAIVDAVALASALQRPDPPTVVDVRPARAFVAGHLPGAVNVDPRLLVAPRAVEATGATPDADADADTDADASRARRASRGAEIATVDAMFLAAVPDRGSGVVVVAGNDTIARAAAAALLRVGRRPVSRLDGGVRAWAEAGFALTSEPTTSTTTTTTTTSITAATAKEAMP